MNLIYFFKISLFRLSKTLLGIILEQFRNRFINFGACNFVAHIKDMYTYMWKKNLNSL